MTSQDDARLAAARSGHDGDERLARSLLGDGDPETAAAALGALARMGALTDADLGVAARGPASLRRRAAQLAAAAPSPASDAVLAALLLDTERLVVEMAAWACGERPHSTQTAEVLMATAGGHAETICREAAVAALGAIGSPAFVETILGCMSDRATVRRRAVLALASYDGPDVSEALRRALGDRDWQVRQAAEDLIDPRL